MQGARDRAGQRCPVKWLWPRYVKGKGQILEKPWNLGKTGEDGERMRKECGKIEERCGKKRKEWGKKRREG